MKTVLVARAIVVLALITGLATVALVAQKRPVPADTQSAMPIPAAIHQLKAHEVIERMISQRHELLLSDTQFEELQGLHRAVREERVIYESTGRSKPPHDRPVWITTPEQALAKAFTILTPQQQHASLMLFAKP